MIISITTFLILLIIAITLGAGIAYIFLKKYTLIKREQIVLLKEENIWYKKALEFAGIGVYKWESKNNMWYWSEKLFEIRGYNEEDKDAINYFYDRVHEDERETLRKAEQKCRKNKGPLSVDYKFMLGNGEIRWHRELANMLSLENESVMYGVVIDITEEKIKEEQLEHYARRDKLTNLPNRAGFDRYFNDSLKEAINSGDSLILCFIDLNGFKSVNDKFGHDKGDHILKVVASCLTSRLHNDFVARLGGDEFVVISKASEDDLEVVHSLLKTTLNAAFNDVEKEAGEMAVGAAIGISIFPQDAQNAKDLLSHADSSMYSAKRTKEWIKIYDYKDHKHIINQKTQNELSTNSSNDSLSK